MRRWIAICLLLALPVAATATPEPLTPQQVARDLRILERGLRELHPGLFRYQDEAAFQSQLDLARAELGQGTDRLALYRMATRIAASVRCGHTWTNPANQRPAIQAALEAQPVLPFEVRAVGTRLLVTASAAPQVRAGDELVAIATRNTAQVIRDLMPYLRADGSNDGKRLSQLSSGANGGALDRLLALVLPPDQGAYRVRLARAGRQVDVRVNATTEAARRAALAGVERPSSAWSLRFDNRIAVFTLPTFAFWNEQFDATGELLRSFETISAHGADALVLDLRRNEGGDSAIGRALLAHLIRQPYIVPAGRRESAYERVPYALARFLETWDYDFFDRTGAVRKGPGRNWLFAETRAPQRVLPASVRFVGPVVALVGPDMSSAGYLIARDLQATGAATLVGQATGGNLRGLNGSEIAWLVLPESGVAIDIPLIAEIFDGAPDNGVHPDIAVTPDLEALAAGRDPEMQAALAWLAARRGR